MLYHSNFPHRGHSLHSIVHDLTQSPIVMSSFEVLQTHPLFWKYLLSTLGVVNLSNDRIITFKTKKMNPHLPPSVGFQVPITIKNIIIQWCIIDEGFSTYVMFVNVWRKLGSLEVVPSTTTLWAYDGHRFQPKGLCKNVPFEMDGKTIWIDVEVVNAPLDYSILTDHSYMYHMQAIDSSVFHTMMFPHKEISQPWISLLTMNYNINLIQTMVCLHLMKTKPSPPS